MNNACLWWNKLNFHVWKFLHFTIGGGPFPPQVKILNPRQDGIISHAGLRKLAEVSSLVWHSSKFTKDMEIEIQIPSFFWASANRLHWFWLRLPLVRDAGPEPRVLDFACYAGHRFIKSRVSRSVVTLSTVLINRLGIRSTSLHTYVLCCGGEWRNRGQIYRIFFRGGGVFVKTSVGSVADQIEWLTVEQHNLRKTKTHLKAAVLFFGLFYLLIAEKLPFCSSRRCICFSISFTLFKGSKMARILHWSCIKSGLTFWFQGRFHLKIVSIYFIQPSLLIWRREHSEPHKKQKQKKNKKKQRKTQWRCQKIFRSYPIQIHPLAKIFFVSEMAKCLRLFSKGLGSRFWDRKSVVGKECRS